MSRRSRKHAQIEPNLTSLIDVTFLLIVFFVLVSHLNEVGSVELNLPRPADAATVPPEAENQVAVNVIPAPEGRSAGYRVGEQTFEPDQIGLRQLTAHLESLYQINPQTNINVRADQSTHFEQVESVLQAVSAAARSVAATGIKPRVNLMVMKD